MRLLLLITASLWVSRCDAAGKCDVQVRGVTDEFKTVIVKKHNELRAKVANGKQGGLPKASNMLEMIWDDTVAKKAQEWANKCKFAHDNPEDRDTGNGYTGQNIADASNQNENPDWEGTIQRFYDEVGQFKSVAIDKYSFQSSTGHFTQIIWANTYKIGCGYVRYLDGSNYFHLYGCDYLPGGNMLGEPIYKRGAPCSACGGCGSIPGLCVAGSTATNSPTFIENEKDNSSNKYVESSDTAVRERNNGVKKKSSIKSLTERIQPLNPLGKNIL